MLTAAAAAAAVDYHGTHETSICHETFQTDARRRNVRDDNEQYDNDNDDYETDDHDSDKLIRTIKKLNKQPLPPHP